MFYGRYLSIIILLAVAGSLASKRTIPASAGTFRTDNAMFTITLSSYSFNNRSIDIFTSFSSWTNS